MPSSYTVVIRVQLSPKDGNYMFLQNAGNHLYDCMDSQPVRHN